MAARYVKPLVSKLKGPFCDDVGFLTVYKRLSCHKIFGVSQSEIKLLYKNALEISLKTAFVQLSSSVSGDNSTELLNKFKNENIKTTEEKPIFF